MDLKTKLTVSVYKSSIFACTSRARTSPSPVLFLNLLKLVLISFYELWCDTLTYLLQANRWPTENWSGSLWGVNWFHAAWHIKYHKWLHGQPAFLHQHRPLRCIVRQIVSFGSWVFAYSTGTPREWMNLCTPAVHCWTASADMLHFGPIINFNPQVNARGEHPVI